MFCGLTNHNLNFFFLQTLLPTTQSTFQTRPHYNGQNSMSYELIGTEYSIEVLDTMFAVAKKKGLRIQVNRIQPSVILVQLSTN